jgi:hypothetical protein
MGSLFKHLAVNYMGSWSLNFLVEVIIVRHKTIVLRERITKVFHQVSLRVENLVMEELIIAHV